MSKSCENGMHEDVTAASVDDEASAAAAKRVYAIQQYHFVEFLTEHLADCSRTFDGDLQQMLVLAIIGQVYLRARLNAGPEGDHGLSGSSVAAAISASRIADVTGIPRETVRRKLAALARRGWIEQADKVGWRLVVRDGAASARSDLMELDRRGAERVSRMVRALKPFV